MIKIHDGLTLASLVQVLPERMMVAAHASCCMCIKALRKHDNFEYMIRNTNWNDKPEFLIYDSGKQMAKETGLDNYTCIGCGVLLREHT